MGNKRVTKKTVYREDTAHMTFDDKFRELARKEQDLTKEIVSKDAEIERLYTKIKDHSDLKAEIIDLKNQVKILKQKLKEQGDLNRSKAKEEPKQEAKNTEKIKNLRTFDRDKSIKPKLAVITSFFNPKNYVNLRANYLAFSKEIKKHADLFPIELSFDGEFFITDENVIRIHGDSNNVLWQKERLLAIALENLPEEYTNVAWLDCDIIFENNNWVEDINEALSKFKVVQVYETAKRLGPNNEITTKSTGIIKSLESSTYSYPPNRMVGITGFGWAIRREVIDEIKFLDTQILGGADALMYFSFFGIYGSNIHDQLSTNWKQHIKQWAMKCFEVVGGSVGYIKGSIIHMYHGTTKNRNYQGRYDVLKSINFNPSTDLTISENGIWEFKNKSLNPTISKYFNERNEDDNVITVNNYFDKVYLLNLDRDKDKLYKASKMLSKFNIEFERFPAIDGNLIPDSEIDSIKFKPGLGIIENKAALGCLKSHLEIIKDAKKNRYRSILIFEDDITLDPLFELKLQSLKQFNEWKLIYLGATQYRWKGLEYIGDFYRSANSLGTYGYAVHSSAYDDIIHENNYVLAVDSVLARVQEKHKDSCYTFYPNICVPDVSSSNIRESRDQKKHAQLMRWPDFSPAPNVQGPSPIK